MFRVAGMLFGSQVSAVGHQVQVLQVRVQVRVLA
jgi:hypothetical protein